MATPANDVSAARYVIAAGVAAALHVGKLPPALPVLRDMLGISWVEAGFLLSLVQLAGMTMGLVTGMAVQRLGLKRSMMAGLLVLACASAVSASVKLWVTMRVGLVMADCRRARGGGASGAGPPCDLRRPPA